MSSSFIRLRAQVLACLHEIGAPGNVALKGITVHCQADGGAAATIDWPIPFFPPPELDDLERAIVDAIEDAGGPLQQKEIASRAKISVRLVQRTTPRLQDRGLVLRHPSLGFYLPGMHVGES